MTSPEFSVIIPTNRRPAILEPCLAALARQTFARARFEVIVVNDGAHHDLEPLADQMRRSCQLDVTIANVPQGGPGAARNHGAQLAKAPHLAFTDDDCIPEPGWLEAFARELPLRPTSLLGGPVTNLLPNRAGSEASQVLVEFLYAYYNADPENARFFTSNNMATTRATFLEHGGFDAGFQLNAGEDRDLCARWREQGGRLVFVGDARIGHAHDLSFAKFLNQHYRYGRGAAAYWQARSHATLRVEPARFYLRLLTYPFHQHPPLRALRASALLGVSQLANTLGFLLAAGRIPLPGKRPC
jgi:GT2 family glycosyltransferase